LSQTLDENSEPIFSITQTTTQFFNSYKPENFDVLIISSPEKIFNLNLLKDFIQKGGTAIILPGENSTSTAFNKALEQLGLNQIEGVSGSKESKTSFTRFKKLEFGHPIFSGIFSEKTPERIESPKIFFSFNYKPTLNGKEIITLENNYSFLCEEKIGAGSVLLFSSAMSLNWNEFPLKPIFAPLINRITLYSNSFNSDLTFIAGEEAQIKLKRTYNDLRLIEPDGKELIISQDTNKDGLVNLGRLEKIGNYKLMSKDELIGIISVNIDKKESILQKLDESVLRDFNKSSFPDGRLKVLSADVNPTEIIKQERYGTELWKLFLILVLICLVFEMIIAKSSKKDLIDLQKGNGV
jgi:hypothetical protein